MDTATLMDLYTAEAPELETTAEFWIAEDYHQDFYRTNPAHYTRYRTGCGRDARLREVWGDAAGH